MRIERRATGSLAAVMATVVLIVGWRGSSRTQQNTPPPDQVPQFTKDGALTRPAGWETWVMVGASTGLSYNNTAAPAVGEAPGLFHNVFLQPWAYRRFMETGAFPEGAMFVLSFYEASRKATPARAGFYEGDQLAGFEVHLKKAGVDASGWAFYNFGEGTATATKIPPAAPCYACHAKEAAHDNVFTQFYPPLRARLAKQTP